MKKNKTKDLLIAFTGVLLIGIGFYLIKAVDDSNTIMKTLPYLCIGLGCGLFGYGLGEVISKKAIESDPKLAKQIEIDTKDERNVMIGNMAKAKGFDMMLYIYSALLLTFALMGISFTVIIPMLVAYLFIIGYSIYHRLKIEKSL
ncbi:hypothetical protein [Enterococcus sp.]|uniref:hypothetical protein n=1 Tax=Enterococcus sp. TaxID=35783 RepID=UPI002909D785|nr:hypothetical protein [Enterococcus sp.]MDU5337118.1 hypothetical protein [Enterococcus sp.]